MIRPTGHRATEPQRTAILLRQTLTVLTLVFFLNSCSKPVSVPATFSETTDSLVLSPDYRDVTVPPNIAPLNFKVIDLGATEFVVQIGDLVCGASADGKVDIDTTAWRSLMTAYRGSDVEVCVYARRTGGWVRYAPYRISVAEEEIDPYLSYRLIEPGYELYRQLGLYQRDVTTFDEHPIYENNRQFDEDENHCVNCHNYQNYDTHRMLFHVRASHGGTVVCHDKEATKVTLRHDSILATGVYPSWHPTLPLVALSTNKTGQVFHMMHAEKIEVIDEASDLLLFDAETNTVRHVLRTQDALETFPCWTPDGRRLYYCSARLPKSLGDEYTQTELVARFDSLKYDIWSMPFDADTRRFGAPKLEVEASAMGHSTSVPRVSPDGRYLLFTMGDYGQFHIWHKSADLWVKEIGPTPAREGEEPSGFAEDDAAPEATIPHGSGSGLYPLAALNSPEADSYHTWSSNGRWIVFASRRDDGGYSRVYISYFDNGGHAHKAFRLPQRDPDHDLLLLKSYNVPELTRSAVQLSIDEFNHIVLHTDAQPTKYEE